jgi:hypothetical protein
LCVEQLWHENLQDDTRALVILLQVGSVELGGHEVIFQGHSPLLRDQQGTFVALTLHRILEFLAMGEQ